MVAGSIAVALTAEKNAFMAQRVAESVPQTAPQNDRLFGYQAAVLHRNKYAIELQAQKFPGVKRATTKLLSQESLPSIAADKVSLGVMRAAAHCRMQSGKESLRQLLSLLDANPNDVGLLLTVIQLYVQLSNPVPAVALLEAFFKRLEAGTTPDHADVRFAPGLVSVAVALFRLQGRPSAIRAELARAAAHWQRKRGKASSAAAAPSRISTYDSLLRVAGIELLQSSNPADLATAGHAFEQLVRANPHDRAARAGLVASFATVDFARVQPHLDGLTPVDELVAGVDAETLLEAGVAVLDPKPAGQKRGPDEGGAAKQQQQQAPKRRRRNKPAKNAVEGRAPDPERWLPLRDRSSYRPKGKKGKKRAAEATQGGVVREEETLELAGGAGSVRVEKAPAGGSGGGGGGGGGKKKKGKK